MRFRKLRIAWSVVWCVACVLLIVLWVRSYWWKQTFKRRTFSQQAEVLCEQEIASDCGRLYFRAEAAPFGSEEPDYWYYETYLPPPIFHGAPSFSFIWNWHRQLVQVPHWFPAIVCFAFAAVPWLRWRFSLRTLLITTTLIAAVLGIIVYATRQ